MTLIIKITKFFFLKKKEKKKILVISRINQIKNIKKKISLNKFNIIIINNNNKNYLKKIIIFIYILNVNFYNKNFIIFYDYKKSIKFNNFIPIWSGSYFNHNFLKSLLSWIKTFFCIFYYTKSIKFLIFVKNENNR